MPIYERSASAGIEVVDEWEDGMGWISHPDEQSRRVSHAIRSDDGVWVFDPLDGPGVDERISELGSVAGVALLSSHHSRDAGTFADIDPERVLVGHGDGITENAGEVLDHALDSARPNLPRALVG